MRLLLIQTKGKSNQILHSWEYNYQDQATLCDLLLKFPLSPVATWLFYIIIHVFSCLKYKAEMFIYFLRLFWGLKEIW